MRTIVELPDDQLERLDAWCRQEGISRAEGVRRALAAHLRRAAPDAGQAYGLWRAHPVDGLEYERRLRSEWGPDAPPAVRRK